MSKRRRRSQRRKDASADEDDARSSSGDELGDGEEELDQPVGCRHLDHTRPRVIKKQVPRLRSPLDRAIGSGAELWLCLLCGHSEQGPGDTGRVKSELHREQTKHPIYLHLQTQQSLSVPPLLFRMMNPWSDISFRGSLFFFFGSLLCLKLSRLRCGTGDPSCSSEGLSSAEAVSGGSGAFTEAFPETAGESVQGSCCSHSPVSNTISREEDSGTAGTEDIHRRRTADPGIEIQRCR